MNTKDRNRVCPVEAAGGLDNFFRKLVQDPKKILKPYIQPWMTVLDIGCGPGFFTVEIAKMLNGSGAVIAADIQEGMLDKVRKKISDTILEKKIILHKCEADRIGVSSSVDFVLAFYVVHEVSDHSGFFNELKLILRPGGKVLVIEPNFHVTAEEFENMIDLMLKAGFKIVERPKVFFSRCVLAQSG